MIFDKKQLTDEELRELYKHLLLPRLIEEKMLLLLRQGKITKWFSGIGQEATSVGTTAALESDEYVCPLHRNLGVFTTRNIPLPRLFKQLQGKKNGFSKGRERSFHFGTTEYGIAGMISHLGPQLNVGDGIALGSKLKNDGKVTVAFTGDGGTSEGDFHEALNIASVWDLPIIFLIENNEWGLSTPVKEQYKCKNLADRGSSYAIEALTIDGNNVLEVFNTVSEYAKKIRKDPKPVIIECKTFRMRGHEEASGIKYVPKELFEEWAEKDPINLYEEYLLSNNVISSEEVATIREKFTAEIESALEETFSEPEVVANLEEELSGIYKSHTHVSRDADTSNVKEMRLVDALADGLDQAMNEFDNLILMGQDIAEYGGVFKVTKGLLEKYGTERVRNTPLCESGILSATLGLSLKNVKSVVEMQFADFVASGFNAVVNNIAKVQYRWDQNVDTVIRMPTGAGVGAGPFHSQSNEAWFFHTPGLKIVYPSNPFDAKGLLISAIEDPNPVMVFEHKALYRSISAEVPLDYYNIPIGKASITQAGEQLSIISYGYGVHWAKQYSEANPQIDLEILDLRSLAPLDYEAIKATTVKTGRVLLLTEDTLGGSIMSDISAWITENCFENLDAPVRRVGSLDTPVPFAKPLEDQFLPSGRISAAVDSLLNY